MPDEEGMLFELPELGEREVRRVSQLKDVND
jgi:hypothetical protein